MSIKTVNKPDWYGEPEHAWFPTMHAFHHYGVPHFEGYINLHHATEVYPQTEETDVTCWVLLHVSEVKNPTVIFPPFKRV